MKRLKEDLSLLKTAEVNRHLLSPPLWKSKITLSLSFSFSLSPYNLIHTGIHMHTNTKNCCVCNRSSFAAVVGHYDILF